MPPLGQNRCAALLVLPQILAQGWVLVATDYTGPGTKGPTPFLIGQCEARSVLDAVRAAHQHQQGKVRQTDTASR